MTKEQVENLKRCRTCPQTVKKLQREYGISDKQLYELRLASKRQNPKTAWDLYDSDRWFLWNSILNAARVMTGKNPVPWTENPYLFRPYNPAGGGRHG